MATARISQLEWFETPVFWKEEEVQKMGSLPHVWCSFCSSQPQEGWTEGCASQPRQPFSTCTLISPHDQPDSKGNEPKHSCVIHMWCRPDSKAGELPPVFPTHKSKLKFWKSKEGCPTPSEQQMQKQKSLWGDSSFTSVWGHLGTYLWHSLHPSADTTPCACCLAKRWFATGNRNTSLLQHQHQLLFSLQHTQNKFLTDRKQHCVPATWARPCFHLLPGAALLVLCRLDDESPGPRLAPGCLKAPAIDAGELTGAPLWPLCQVAVACTLKQEITGFQKELALKDKLRIQQL